MRKTRILALNPAKWLHPPTSTTELTLSIQFVWLARLHPCSIKNAPLFARCSFITKFNRLKSSAYNDYALVLAGDLTGLGHEDVNLDNHHAIVKRLGLAQIPLFVVTVRFCIEVSERAKLLYYTWLHPLLS